MGDDGSRSWYQRTTILGLVVLGMLVGFILTSGGRGQEDDDSSFSVDSDETSPPLDLDLDLDTPTSTTTTLPEPGRSPPGTPLGAGFVVAPGTELVAEPIPTGMAFTLGGEPVVDDGWVATTVVKGDPILAADDYVQQARARGMEVVVPADAGADWSLADACRAGEIDPVVTCVAGLAEPDGSPSLVVEVRRGTARGDMPQNHLFVRYSTLERPHSPGEQLFLLDGPVADLPGAAAAPPEPVEVGDPLWGDLDDAPRQVLLEEGSRPVGPPAHSVGSPFPGTRVLLEVTAEPTAVLEAYEAQLVERYGEVFPLDAYQGEGVSVRGVAADEAGGDKIQVRLVERPGRPPWIDILAGHD